MPLTSPATFFQLTAEGTPIFKGSDFFMSRKSNRNSETKRFIRVSPAESAIHKFISNKLQEGIALHRQGYLDQARVIYEEILKTTPHHFDALQLLGTLAGQQQEWQRAASFISKALKIDPKHTEAWNNLGNVKKELRQLKEALSCYDKAIALDISNADTYFNRGNALKELERLSEALDSYKKAIALKSNDAEFYYNQGIVLQDLKYFDEALESFNKALSLNPLFAKAHLSLGSVLKDLEQIDDALTSIDRAIELDEHYAEAHYNRGVVLINQLRLDEAIQSFDLALSLQPNFPDTHWNRSLCHLLMGNFRDGWEGYEWRFRLNSIANQKRTFNKPLWLGDTSIQDKKILLHAEQGLGDTIQFSRYVELISQLGAKVILEVQESLLVLLKNLPGLHSIITVGDNLPEFDLHCPLLSLPLALQTESHTIPLPSKNISTDPQKIKYWSQRLGIQTSLRIGIVWSGNVEHKSDKSRSLLLSQFMSCLPKNCSVFSLQKEIRNCDSEALGNSSISHFGEELKDFSDTAALCELMDVIISVDTSVAHLAATLNKPTWLLIGYPPDWRWMLDRCDSPWYPSMKLYRRRSLHNWNEALENLKDDLEGLVELHVTKSFTRLPKDLLDP